MFQFSGCFKLVFITTIFVVLTDQINAEDCVITDFDQVSTVVEACQNIVIDNLKVPGGKQLDLKLKEGTVLTFRGNTSFGFFEWKGPLIKFQGTDIIVRGEKGSVLDGQGPLWWDGQGTWGNTTKPRFATMKVTNATFENINVLNCPVGCFLIRGSQSLTIRNWNINILEGDEGVAPLNKFAHNTDGFGIGGSSNNILIEDTVVYNQDDCVAVTGGKNITIRRMFCHGSHGLSISGGAEVLEDVIIEDSIVTMAENGIHIKTHVDAGDGLIKNVTYRNITLLDSKFYGINIQQNYKNLPAGKPQDGPPKNNIPIHNLQMINIFGNVLNGAVPVFILCAEEGCFDWKWEGVTIYGAVADNCTNFIPVGYEC